MKRQSRTIHAADQVETPTSRHLPLVDLLIDTRAELTELVVRSGLKVLEAMLRARRAKDRDSAPACPTSNGWPAVSSYRPSYAVVLSEIESGTRRSDTVTRVAGQV